MKAGVIEHLNKAQERMLSPFERIMDRPTKRDFAQKVDRLEDLDPVVCQALQAALGPGEEVLTLIKVPSQFIDEEQKKETRRFFFSIRRILTPEWVLALTGKRLLLAAGSEPGAVPVLFSLPFENILSFQRGSVLLFSWIEFRVVQDGQLKRTRIYYNTVSSPLFEDLSSSVRGFINAQNGRAAMSEEGNGQFLQPLNFKFKNLISLYLLMPGEEIQAIIFRPSMWNKGLSFFRRHVAANLAVVTSDSYFMLVEENLSEAKTNYGMIYSYFPLHSVKGLSVYAEEEKLELVVSMQLRDVEQEVRVVFPPECENEVRSFAAEFKRKSG